MLLKHSRRHQSKKGHFLLVYLEVMCKKAMENVVAKVIRETHRKEKEENRVRKSTNYLIVDE